jgi:hypothetical protein
MMRPNRRSPTPEAADPVTLGQDAVARSASQDELDALLWPAWVATSQPTRNSTNTGANTSGATS